MSYPMDFLYLKKGGEFAELWHAGILSRQQFTAKLKKKNVNAIDVAETSQKLTDRLVQNDTSLGTLSLVQSSTMMLGAARILNYQADAALTEVEKFLKDWEPKMPVEKKKKRKKRNGSPGDDVFRVPADPGTPDYSKNAVSNPDDITINEDHILTPVPIEEQPGYFGGISTDLRDEILENDYRLFGTEVVEVDWGSAFLPVRAVPTPQRSEPAVEVPVVATDDTTGPEVPVVPVVPGTPKRKPTSPKFHDTPKRPRIPENQEPEAEPIPPQDPVEPQVEPPISDMSPLRLLRPSNIPAPRPRRKKRMLKVDKHKILSEEEFRERQANDYIDTNPRGVPIQLGLIRPRLLDTPCTQVARGSAWIARLLLDYQSRLTAPIFRRDDNAVPPESQPRVPEPEPDRGTEQVSKNLQRTSITIPTGSVSVPTEPSGSVQPVADDPLPFVLPVVEEPPNVEPGSGPDPPLPDDVVPSPDRRNRPSLARKIIADFEGTGAVGAATPSVSDGTNRPNDSGSHDVTSEPVLMEEFRAELKRFWSDKPVVDFEDLCPVDETTQDEAAHIFGLLLTLYREKEIVMFQEELWGRIIIKKYSESEHRCMFCNPDSDVDSD